MEMESKGKILLVEDDYNLGIITRKRLIEAWYEVDHVAYSVVVVKPYPISDIVSLDYYYYYYGC